jgi:hypothetical protein
LLLIEIFRDFLLSLKIAFDCVLHSMAPLAMFTKATQFTMAWFLYGPMGFLGPIGIYRMHIGLMRVKTETSQNPL